jgi:hypothetical protein
MGVCSKVHRMESQSSLRSRLKVYQTTPSNSPLLAFLVRKARQMVTELEAFASMEGLRFHPGELLGDLEQAMCK